ncbi:unnamed protein product [Cuscuta europaea]|uniref:Uncharacterized protein n=1 Tax=Cuscuta europaea TaxID=41803 RepID=A0A9P0ZD46_CUSEU|nr:unnamed protein product [Cuscuta europaea]
MDLGRLARMGAGKRKKPAKKAPRTGDARPSQPVAQEAQPFQQVPVDHVNLEHMEVESQFEAAQTEPLFTDLPGSDGAAKLDAMQAELGKLVKPISLEDPIQEVMEQAGCSLLQIWNTTADMNDFRLPPLSMEQAKTGAALATMKAGLYNLKLHHARSARETELVKARSEAEQVAADAICSVDQERKKLEEEIAQLRVSLATAQAKVAAAEAAQIVFKDRDPQISDGPREITADLSTVRATGQSEFRSS